MAGRAGCAWCGAPKEPGRGKRLCPSCAEKREAQFRCHRCGSEKPAGRGRRLCDECEPVAAPKPCRKCGEVKPKMRGRTMCDDCAEAERWRAQKRRRGKRAMQRKPCRGCGRPKGDGQRRIYCDACRADRQAPRTCRTCGVNPITTPRAKQCDTCRALAPQRKREYVRAYKARKRAEDPTYADRVREWERRSRQKAAARRKRDKQAADRLRERRRLSYRLRRERRDGIHVDKIRYTPARSMPQSRSRVLLPVAPLLGAIEARAEREGEPAFTFATRSVGVEERQWTRWKSGESRSVLASDADRVLIALDLLWFDVWAPEDDGYGAARAAWEGEPSGVAA